MEQTLNLVYNGQGVLQSDLNAVGDSAGRADDRVFAEMFRMFSNTSNQKVAILPYGINPYTVSTPADVGTVVPSAGGVIVRPFRAFVAPNDSEIGITPLETWRGAHSAVSVGTSSISQSVALANASGFNLIAGIYARVNLKAAPTTPRKVKDVTTKAVATVNTVSVQYAQVTIEVAYGTNPAGVLTYPVQPVGSVPNGIYYIPLAYVMLPVGFTGATTVANNKIVEVAPILSALPQSGVSSAFVAEVNTTYNVPNNRDFKTLTTRDIAHMPASFGGGVESVQLMLDLRAGATLGNVPASGILDTTRDYRNRIFRIHWFGLSAGTELIPWAIPVTDTATPTVPTHSGAAEGPVGYMVSSSFNGSVGLIAGHSGILFLSDTSAFLPTTFGSWMGGGNAIFICVNQSNGNLVMKYAGTPTPRVYIWIDMTPQYANR